MSNSSRTTRYLLPCVMALMLVGCATSPTTPEEQLLAAAYQGDLATVQRLHESGASLDYRVRYFTPLIQAATQGHTDVVRYLVAHGANLNDLDGARNPPGAEAMTVAAINGHRDVMEVLVIAGADPRQTYKAARKEKNSFSQVLGDAMLPGNQDEPYDFAINLIESRSPWFHDGTFVRPGPEAMAAARERVRQSMPAEYRNARAPASAPTGATGAHDDFAKLRNLKALLDEGVITQEEFDAQKAAILEDGV